MKELWDAGDAAAADDVYNDECVCAWQASEEATSEEASSSALLHGAEEELLPCPLCFKTCSSRLELDAHMDTHPDMALRYTHTGEEVGDGGASGEKEQDGERDQGWMDGEGGVSAMK